MDKQSQKKSPAFQVRPRRIFIITAVAVQIILYIILWTQMIWDHDLRTGSDFIIFYTAGQIAQTEGAERVYDIELQREIVSEQVGIPLETKQILPYNHLPYLVPLLKLMVSDSYARSFIGWTILLLFFMLLNIISLIRSLSYQAFDKNDRWVMAFGALLFFPVFISLINGQDSIFVLSGVILWMTGVLSKKPVIAGIGLAITTQRPQVALMLSIPFLFRERKVWWWFLICSILLLGLSLLIIGLNGLRDLISMLLLSTSGEGYGFHEADMLNLTGLLQRLTPNLGSDTIHLISWLGYSAAIGFLCIFWMKSKSITHQQIGIAVILSVVLAPFLHYHDLALLLVPIFCLISILGMSPQIKPKIIAIFPLAISLILIFSFSRFEIIKYSIPYFVMLALGYFIWYPQAFAQFVEKVKPDR